MFELDACEASPRPQIDVVADCHALQVGEFCVKSGESRAFDRLPAAAALVFHEGKGVVSIAGCSHAIAAGTVELLCPGEPCAICATEDVRAFLITCKNEDRAS